MTPTAEEVSMVWLRQIIAGQKQLVARKDWIPCTYRFHYKGTEKETCAWWGLKTDKSLQDYLPNFSEWKKLSRDYVRNQLRF